MTTAGKYLANQIQMVLAGICLGRQLYSNLHLRPGSENPAQLISLGEMFWREKYSNLGRYFHSGFPANVSRRRVVSDKIP